MGDATPMLRALIVLAAAGSMAACAGAPPPPEGFQRIGSQTEFLDEVAGKPITFPNGAVLVANRDGTMGGQASGQPVTGSWSWSNGLFCRTVAAGGQAVPEVCAAVEVDEPQVRFVDPDGAVFAEGMLG